MPASPPVIVYTLTFNEARQIRAVLESVRWADELIVVDSLSTDGTAEIAREFGARILSEKFCGFGALRNKALAAAATWTYTSRNPLIRFRRDYFWEDIALLLKRCTGITLGVHKNYRLIP